MGESPGGDLGVLQLIKNICDLKEQTQGYNQTPIIGSFQTNWISLDWKKQMYQILTCEYFLQQHVLLKHQHFFHKSKYFKNVPLNSTLSSFQEAQLQDNLLRAVSTKINCKVITNHNDSVILISSYNP